MKRIRKVIIEARQTESRRSDAGYTLTELLVVMFILVLLIGLVGPRVIGYLGGAKTDTARIQLGNIEASLDLYLIDVGKYPDQSQGLDALVAKPDGVVGWNGPYLKKKSGIVDPWDQEYHYKAPGDHGVYDLWSLGADNEEGGEDEDADVQGWE